MAIDVTPHAHSTTPHGEAEGGNNILLEFVALDPLEELDTPRLKVQLTNGSGTANSCCPECRRPFALDLNLRQSSVIEKQTSCSSLQSNSHSRLHLRVRNAHDSSARWLAASCADTLVPVDGICSAACLACPHCKRDIRIEFRRTGHSETDTSPNVALKVNDENFAYATLLYGSAIDYFIGALVLGWTLWKPVLEPEKTNCYRRILLHTGDVPPEYLHLLSIFWELRPVDYLTGSTAMYHDHNGSRFKEVFTKLQVLSQVDLDKVLMLDNDLIVRRNIDELFNLPTPAALKRPGGRDQPQHGERFRASLLWAWRQLEKGEDGRGHDIHGWKYDMMSGINAGVMLFRPDRLVYKRMLAEISDDTHPEHLGCFGPEQEYLGRFYSTFGPGWTHLDARFNYQPLLGRGANRFMQSLDARREVAIAHFSGPRIKPWAGLVARHERLDVESLNRLICETPEDFALRFPENSDLPATGPTSYGGNGFPTLVVSLISEWTQELRHAVQHLCERQGTDLLATVLAVKRRERSVLGKINQLLPFSWRVLSWRVVFLAIAPWLTLPLITAIRRLLQYGRRRAAMRAIQRPV